MATTKQTSKPARSANDRYVALLRGVSPMNLRMADLKRCLEEAGFANVVTVRSSGNVVFDVPRSATREPLERRLERVLAEGLERGFPVIVRSVAALETLLAADPFAAYTLPSGAKRVVTFLRAAPTQKLEFPIEGDDAWLLELRGSELLSAYVPNDKGPVFMPLIEKAFGKDVTTRTWDSVRLIASK